QSEEFNTASRSIKPGLLASAILSSWTWSATVCHIVPLVILSSLPAFQLLTSSTFGYTYGICGPVSMSPSRSDLSFCKNKGIVRGSRILTSFVDVVWCFREFPDSPLLAHCH